MGKREADRDGIEYYYDPNVGSHGHQGSTVYLVPCEKCGKKIKRVSYGRNATYICDACRCSTQKKKEVIANAWLDEIETKGEHRFNQALDEIQKQVSDFSEYSKAVELARRGAEKYGSVPEAMVAVELLRLHHSIIPQQKIGCYRVDFYLPKIKMIIEVDGGIWHSKKNTRDAELQLILGLDTMILHVPAELIRSDIQKLSALIETKRKMP